MSSKYPEVGIDYMADLAIDKYALDDEWLDQSIKMMRYSELHSQAIYDRDRAKQALDIAKANADASVRTSAASSGEKVTEALVEGRVRNSIGYIEAKDAYMKAEYKVNLFMGAVSAFQFGRKAALENLVRLHLASYFSNPVSPEGAGAVEETAAAKRTVGQEAALAKEMGSKPGPTPVSAPSVAPRPTPVAPTPTPVPSPTPRPTPVSPPPLTRKSG